MPRQPSLPTMLVPALGTDDAKPRLTRGNNQTTSHPPTPRSPSRAQDHVRTVKEHSISFLTSPAPSYMPLGGTALGDGRESSARCCRPECAEEERWQTRCSLSKDAWRSSRGAAPASAGQPPASLPSTALTWCSRRAESSCSNRPLRACASCTVAPSSCPPTSP